MIRRAARPVDDEGTMTLEMVFATPIILLLLGLLVISGRVVDAQSQVDGAARDAARAASTARAEGAARDLAQQAATGDLAGHDWCEGGPQISPDTTAWGAGGRVTVTVTCRVDFSDLALPGFPGSRTLTGKAVAPIDTYTYRGGGTP
ncbi:TadE/TadG family type IV pilus assembly protein [Actinomadura oligospora]|uniref:TadE/TadG family type IV pilus assembly protein n=1 Tax=Actinomadura oligospora TaxID=111804 RepID=UPI00047E3784|nr:TadE/TadG family type IV pilus assembly protein [Actinomadura oligospora]